ncbi:hypothetical protein TWF694_010072 [Orbilia ellipsospora]|uniref:Uncharacterized protein n=1 Tax=Orbilia ellipsospora TaxID=2528407 RepID=A0AAV9X9S7_9PEZI
MLTSRFSLWAVALFAFATLCAARTVITTQRCTTRYCGQPAKVYRTTKTIHKSTPYTVTRWKTTTKPKYTVKSTGTKTVTSQPYNTIWTVTSWHTILIGTSTSTRKYTAYTPATTVTEPLVTAVVTPPVHTVSAPAGFVGVNDDVDNQKAGVTGHARRDVAPPEMERREAAPEPEPEPEPVPGAKQYVTAITCTKTYLTKTGTSALWKTTTKTTGTITKLVAWTTQTYVLNPINVTPKNAKTINTTTSVYKVVITSTTTTLTTGTTTVYEKTVTSTLPVETNYLACGDRNQSPNQALRIQNFAVADKIILTGDTSTQVIKMGNGEAYDCCVLCHTYPGPELCVGSIYYHTGLWGAPCWDWTHEDCDVHEPEFNMQCNLYLTANKPGVCPHAKFSIVNDITINPVVVSNGPHCARWKYYR